MNMAAIEQHARQLAQGILSSDEYHEFDKVCREVRQDPVLYEKINRIRKEYFMALSRTDGEDMRREAAEVFERHSETMENGCVKEFLEKEHRYFMMMQKVFDILGEVMNFDMSFIRDGK